jgi:general secretion pathway protein G
MKLSVSRSGFTLVELLAVIVTIGILAGTLMLAMVSARDNAEAARIISEMRTMKSAACLYCSDYGIWPRWVFSGAYGSGKEEEYVDAQGNALPDAYTDKLPVNENYWIGVMHAPGPKGSDQAFVLMDDRGLRKGVKKILASKAESMGFMARSSESHSFFGLHVFSIEDDNIMWFLTGSQK